jgi:hypothetical protein
MAIHCLARKPATDMPVRRRPFFTGGPSPRRNNALASRAAAIGEFRVAVRTPIAKPRPLPLA